MRFLQERGRGLRGRGIRIVFPEGGDPRVREAARRLEKEEIAEPILLMRSETRPELDRLAAALHQRRKHRGLSLEQARKLAQQPLYFGCLMVAEGLADGFVGGCVNTTAETLRACLACIGLKDRNGLSSFFFMELDDRRWGENGLLMFADCAVNIDPSAEKLASIALQTADSWRRFLGTEPRVAMLSFSTKGSAQDASVEKVRKAVEIARGAEPGLLIDGEIQADAALVEEIGGRKAPGSEVAGRANILIFPNLDSGNISYKLVQRLAGARACGPILQGLARPANDLSRGADAEEVYNVAVVTAMQAVQAKQPVGIR